MDTDQLLTNVVAPQRPYVFNKSPIITFEANLEAIDNLEAIGNNHMVSDSAF